MPTERDAIMSEFVRSLPMLRAFLRHLGARPEAIDEVVQETTVWLCDRWADYRDDGNFGTWIRTVARYRFLEHLRRHKREIATDDLSEVVPDAAWDAMTMDDERRTRLAGCIGKLSDRQRELLLLVYRDGEAAATIARLWRSSTQTIYVTLSRVRTRLRDCIERGLRRASR